MKVLTIKQPWATLVALGVKDIENRTWKTNYRGRIYIHSAAKPSFNSLVSNLTKDQIDQIVNTPIRLDASDEYYTKSAIIGEVDIVDCVVNHSSIWAEKTDILYGAYTVGKPIYNWVLANPVFYEEPILNVKGALSFWEWKGGDQ